jgi:hypothetical protein
MQQQRERSSDKEEISDLSTRVYRYNTRQFWVYRILAIVLLCSAPVLLWFSTHTRGGLSGVLNVLSVGNYVFCASILTDWLMKRREERWIREHGHEVITVEPTGILWQSGDKTVWMRWDEIKRAYIKDNVCILGGKEEEEIRFWNTTSCLHDVGDKWSFISFKALSTIIAERCPLVQTHPWQVKDEETIAAKSPRVAFQVSGGQVFSYYTHYNKAVQFDKSARYTSIGFIISLILALLSFRFISGYYALATLFISLLFVFWKIHY